MKKLLILNALWLCLAFGGMCLLWPYVLPYTIWCLLVLLLAVPVEMLLIKWSDA